MNFLNELQLNSFKGVPPLPPTRPSGHQGGPKTYKKRCQSLFGNQADLEDHVIMFLSPFWHPKDTSNGAPRLTLRLEGSLEGRLELDAIRPPKLADTRKMLYPACGAASRKVLITYIAQSQSKFVMQRCMSRCRAAGCRRRRRRSGRGFSERTL